jgi:transposase
VRLRRPVRDQVELRVCDLESLLADDHPARVIWAYVTRLDLSALEAGIKARAGKPGQPATDPRLLLALWLYAISQGVGSARGLAGLCTTHDAYRWLCGGVSVNYHTLSDFRTAYPTVLDRLLTESVAGLLAAGLIDLEQLAQDGLRVRASAGAGSFRRRKRLDKHLADARALVDRLSAELEDDPAAGERRRQAARARAARERLQRVERALSKLDALEAGRAGARNNPDRDAPDRDAPGRDAAGRDAAGRDAADQDPPGSASPTQAKAGRTKPNRTKATKRKPRRASTTDPQARVMKMADGGFRPAYNLQFASLPQAQVIVGTDVDTTGSDRGWLRPMLEQIGRRYGQRPKRYLADGGFIKAADINWAHEKANGSVEVYLAPTHSKHGTDPYTPRPRDKPGVLAWRARMATPEGQARYRERGPCECVHGRFAKWGLPRLTVRGTAKVSCIAMLFALANNILQGERLHRQAAPA